LLVLDCTPDIPHVTYTYLHRRTTRPFHSQASASQEIAPQNRRQTEGPGLNLVGVGDKLQSVRWPSFRTPGSASSNLMTSTYATVQHLCQSHTSHRVPYSTRSDPTIVRHEEPHGPPCCVRLNTSFAGISCHTGIAPSSMLFALNRFLIHSLSIKERHRRSHHHRYHRLNRAWQIMNSQQQRLLMRHYG